MVKVSALSGLAKGSETVRDYLSHGSDENQGVEAGEKTADTSSKLIHGIKKYSDKKRAKRGYDLTNKDYKIRKRKSKLEFRDAKGTEKTDEYKEQVHIKDFKEKSGKGEFLVRISQGLEIELKRTYRNTEKLKGYDYPKSKRTNAYFHRYHYLRDFCD